MSDRREIEAAVRACEERAAKLEGALRALVRELIGQQASMFVMQDPEVVAHHVIARLWELERENRELRGQLAAATGNQMAVL